MTERRPRARRDGGFTVTEFVVAMGALSVLLVVFLLTVRVMASTAIRVQSVADTSTQGRQALDRFSRQISYASAVNLPVSVVPSDTPASTEGAAWYLELFSEAVLNGGTSTCTQWRLLPVSDRLQMRTWNVVTWTPSAWTTVAQPVVNDPVTQPPFAVGGTDTTYQLVRVAVDLRIRNRTGPILQSQSQYTIRNSADAPTPSAAAVCANPSTGQVSR